LQGVHVPSREDFSDGRAYNDAVTEEFRANGGQVTGDFAGRDLLILTTTGAKSGKPHVTPLGYTMLNGRMLVSAGAGGQPNNPAWYHNLVANPVVTVEIPGETFQARAVPTVGEEREAIAAERLKTNAGFKRNQERTTRKIPLIWLDRLE
jgi:deazaflavin-dependent oxidoreductase (nitroreductase family)